MLNLVTLNLNTHENLFMSNRYLRSEMRYISKKTEWAQPNPVACYLR